ncbi:universal stress protein [Megasphaera paucivorans]|uniref:Nucleotide-binding universal stress protein, UspA family n=1 Tax=Megasphaera paucivorans TaxID=349095 RepID=A0A1H0AM85_9FIRM|nr:universal stress protein [Megasphaera paucivorans]SDN34587.1 Nucleotide-binding universal stress protein, UspA family [Megasphaera paucivorans]
MTFDTILVPVDGSEQSLRALEKAAYIAGLSGADLTLLHVVDLNKKISSFEQVSTGGYIPLELKEKGCQLLTDLRHRISANIQTEIVVEIGNPAEIIVKYAKAHETDLIVIGNRGLGKLKQVIMGSVSQYVLLRSSCTIMIVK